MSEDQATSERAKQPADRVSLQIVDVGEHLLEVGEGQAVTLIAKTEGALTLCLDGQESYRLLLVLQELFRPVSKENHPWV